MPEQNYALLKSSFSLLQDYKQHLPLTAAFHKEIFKLKSVDIPSFERPGVLKTYRDKDKTPAAKVDEICIFYLVKLKANSES
jgi:hypothetical protein